MTDTNPDTIDTAVAPQPEVVAEPTADEREDAYLMQIDGDDEDTTPEPAEEAAEPEAPAEEAADEEEPEKPSTIDTDELEEAWSVLRRDGFSKEDLAALSDEAISRLAAHRKKVQSDVDRMLNESKQSKDAEQPEQSQTEREEPTTAEATERQPAEANLQAAAKQFADYVGLDEKGAELLAESYSSLLKPLQDQVMAMQNFIANQQIESARVRLADRYPQVADTSSDDWNRVLTRMNKLYDTESHRDLGGLMEDAIAFEFRDQLKQEAESAKTQIRNLRTNGTPAKATGASPEAPALSAEQLEDQVLALLESDAPDRVERARRLTGR
jgi:hypothetical protein